MEDTNKKGGIANNPIVKKIGGQRLVVIFVIIALFAFFWAKSTTFRNYSTVLAIIDSSYYITFIAIGVTFALITGGNDLSIGTGMVCYSLIGAYLVDVVKAPIGVAILVTILCGLIMGTFNGFLVAVLGIPPFIATLCTMMIARGLGSIATHTRSASWPPDGSAQSWFRSMFRLNINGINYPLGFVWVIILVIIMSIILTKTKPGRYIIAIGSNKEATRLSGINVIKWHMLAYIICGLFTSFAALAYGAKFPSVTPGTGAGIELNAICAAIIGGTAMTGGSGSIVGTLLGVFLMSVLQTGLPFIGLQANWQQIIIAIVLIIAVLIDVLRSKQAKRA